MNRRKAIRLAVAGAAAALTRPVTSGVSSPAPAPPSRPNVLFIICDQLNAGILGCYGGSLPTPNIDRVARSGVVFTNATCVYPVCSPSRATMVTGLYPHTHGIVHNVMRVDFPAISGPPTEEGITLRDDTTEKLLHAAGYDTHIYGKWHLHGDPLPYYTDMYAEHSVYPQEMAEVFQQVRKRPREQWMNWYGWALPVTVDPAYQKVVRRLGDSWKGLPFAEFVAKAGRLELPLDQVFDVRVADRVVRKIEQASQKPSMITASINYPHDPNVVPAPYYGMVQPSDIRFPANFGHCEKRFETDWSRRMVADLGEVGLRELLRIYYASVRLADDQIGRILNALEKSGRARDTIIVLTADHGDMAGGHGMFWKSTHAFYDEIVRVPLIVSYPRRVQPRVSDVPVSGVDLMPTLLELTGQKIPSGVQGQSLAPYLLDERRTAGPRKYAFCERVKENPQHTRRVLPETPASFMVRGEGWKYIRYADGEEFLYHLAEDPGEIRNLAGDHAYSARKGELKHELDEWLKRTHYPGY